MCDFRYILGSHADAADLSEARCFMRTVFAGLAVLLAGLVVLGDEPATRPAGGKSKFLIRPDAFETLVNPNCSHCVDESKRRSGELRDNDRVLAWIRGKYDGGAIPLRFFLAPYRVISDTYGVFVYDPDAGYMRGYEPSLDFRFHGWRNGVMVIRTRTGRFTRRFPEKPSPGRA